VAVNSASVTLLGSMERQVVALAGWAVWHHDERGERLSVRQGAVMRRSIGCDP
jgi:hypothetical protein